MTTFFTIGYEGTSFEDWINTIIAKGISLVIDVREKPISRKKGFSKKILAALLKSHNIDYVHIGCLGSPSNLRNNLYETHNYGEFHKKYLNHLIKEKDAVDLLLKIASKNKNACLMCFEKNPAFCHRSAIADYISANYPDKVKVEHIYEYVSSASKPMANKKSSY